MLKMTDLFLDLFLCSSAKREASFSLLQPFVNLTKSTDLFKMVACTSGSYKVCFFPHSDGPGPHLLTLVPTILHQTIRNYLELSTRS